MSEADIPGYEPGLPEVNVADSSHANEVTCAGAPVQPTVEDGWQTVPFPHSVPTEHFSGSGNQSTTRDVVVPVASPDLVNLVQELQQHNNALQNRITQLENAIITGQNTLQVEVERSQQQEALLTQRNQELAAAQERIDRLFQELGSSHQSAQRQQILIETLTAQLESSQERIAQLERECALTQQRHHDQVQLLLHAEDACRDLRARLHRQQRYTLQFKAALEKCLEVAGASPNYFNAPDLAENLAGLSTNKRNFKSIAIQSFTPKTQPVQPWSVQNKLLLQLSDSIQSAAEGTSFPLETNSAPTSEPPHQREWQILQSLRTAAPSDAIVAPLAEQWVLPSEPLVATTPETLETAEPALTELAFEDDAIATESLALVADEPATNHLAESTLAHQANPDDTLANIAFLDEVLEQQALLESLPRFAPELERQIDRIVQSFMSEPGTNDDTLWEDLAHLIGLPAESEVAPAEVVAAQPSESLATQPLELAPESVELLESAVSISEVAAVEEYIATPEAVEAIAIEADVAVETDVAVEADTAVEADAVSQTATDDAEIPVESAYEIGQVIHLFQNLLTERKPGILPHSAQSEHRKTPQPASRFLTVAATLASAPPIEAASIADSEPSKLKNRDDMAALQAPLFQSSAGPSPIVYPLRPTKKLKSLAAVQLPSFPRLG